MILASGVYVVASTSGGSNLCSDKVGWKWADDLLWCSCKFVSNAIVHRKRECEQRRGGMNERLNLKDIHTSLPLFVFAIYLNIHIHTH